MKFVYVAPSGEYMPEITWQPDHNSLSLLHDKCFIDTNGFMWQLIEE